MIVKTKKIKKSGKDVVLCIVSIRVLK